MFDALQHFSKAATLQELADLLHRQPRSIRKQLVKLASHGLVREVRPGRWIVAQDITDAKLDTIAARLNVTGTAARQRRRHERDREAHQLRQK
ncbi:hypothetical protein GKE82_07520 [Conexibacter sp. W3-3-2]|uniref:hypothetical protein n=1 Tax=Conexibacter sp. W3-3-2 TaxID=2675227 RepID=UPI0012B8C855|nr:hypothetical protein [Conexibacter sp. W3-3-2]MTD44152.1 hypothetical protein [Conexibacter sp. W3-3-2]